MSGARPRAVVCGYGEMATLGLEALEDAGWETALLLTHPDSPGETIWWRSPAAWAKARGLEVAMPADPADPGEAARVAALRPDFLLSLYYRSMIGPRLLAVPKRGALNLHGSYLPRYRGRAPLNWVLVNGEAETGVTLHYMDEKPDHGDIVMQRRVAIAFEDTAQSLFRKMAAEARSLLDEALPPLAAGRAPRTPQDDTRATYFGRRRPEDGLIEWGWPALRIYNLVRSVTRPFPGAFSLLGGRKVFIWWGVPADRGPGDQDAAPGTVLGPRAGGVGVAAGSGVFVVMRAQCDGEEERSGPEPLAALLPAGLRLAA